MVWKKRAVRGEAQWVVEGSEGRGGTEEQQENMVGVTSTVVL